MFILAHYRLSMKNGKAGGAVANFQYNMGIGKYSYKENEIITLNEIFALLCSLHYFSQ